MKNLLSCAKKVAEAAEAFQVSSRRTSVSFEANHLKQVQTSESSSVALRIFHKGKIGFAAASGSDDAERLVEMAVETAEFGLPVKFDFPMLGGYARVNTFDPAVEQVKLEEMVAMGNYLVDKIRKHTPGILCDAQVSRGLSSFVLSSSGGGEARYEKSSFSVGVEGMLINGTDMLFVGDGEGSCRMPDGIDALADRVIEQLELARKQASVSTGILPVIFTPAGVANVLLEPLLMAFSGKLVHDGTSPLEGRLGEKVFAENLSVWDDATLDYCLSSSPFDDEGVPTRKLPLIQAGVVANFYYDLQTAAQAGAQSTGSGRRGGGVTPGPSLSSIVIKEGELLFSEMVRDMQEGLVVEQLIGAGQGNTLGGDFGGNVLLGYKVEKGKITGRVKDTMISGNVYEALRQVVSGREARWVEGTVFTPPLYCPAISVAASPQVDAAKEGGKS